MNREERANIAFHVDHTNLKKTATEAEIKKLCEDAIANNTFSVCVAPYFVPFAKEQLKDSTVAVCTVIGFPNGYSTTAVKEAETIDALLNGADEIDMVVNINAIKDGKWQEVEDEIHSLAEICHNCEYTDAPVYLKVIVETCLLTNEEKLRMCEICLEAEADFIKTSTGFDKAGADIDDIKMMHEYINGRGLYIKASGGIKTLEQAQAMLNAGADRIGASSLFEEKQRDTFDEIR